MASKIILKKSSVASKVPTTSDLDFGELAINYTDSKLYFKKSDGTIDSFATASAAGVTSFNGLTGAITATNALDAIKDVDGDGSGLDADFLDGQHASAFYLASNPSGYTSNTGTVTSVTAGTGLTGGSITTSGTIALDTSGVTVGTYKSVTVDTYGRVTAGTNPTTLAGYGITDATPSSHVGSTGTAHGVATTSVNGFMSSTDKSKLDGIATGANNYTLPAATSTVLGGIELFSDTIQATAANAVTSTASRTYGVQVNSAGQAVVNVPWTDTSSGGTVTSVSGTGSYGGLTLSGTVTTSGSLTLGGTPTGTWPISVSGSSASTTGNAATATTLQTARTINGTSFNGSANITTANWGTARTLTIGSTGKSINGSANVSWSVDEIGALSLAPERSLSVTSTNWVTISQTTSGRAFGEFYVYDVDSGRHNAVKIIANHAYGQSSVVVLAGNRYNTRTIAHVRILYNTADRVYGGAKLQIYCENPTFTLRVRRSITSQLGGWTGWNDINPVLEGTPSGWAEDNTTRFDDITNTGTSLNGIVQGSLIGNATTATTLQTARTINGVSFNGSANITITAAANGGTSAAVTVNNSDANSTYRMLWHSGNTVYSTAGIYCNPSTDILYASQLQALSDERLKTNWRSLHEDYVEKLSQVKSGVYDRTDIELTQAGSSAQDWQKLLPEVVSEDENGVLSLAYSNAALVSAVELAKRVVNQEKRIKELEILVSKLIEKE